MSEQLAVIKHAPKFGLRDIDRPVMWFEVWIDEGCAAMVCLHWDAAGKALKDANIVEAEHLAGRSCWVEIDNGIVRFKRFWKWQ